MPKYRKKPVVIEAVEWFPNPKVTFGYDKHGVEYTATGRGIHTLEGFLNISPGDWLITGVNGEKYPCKPDIFALTYEPA